MYSRARKPQTAVVVGAGMVGLSTAWHLQEQGIDVTVVDRSGVAAGASWGNAGWLTPGMAMPLAEPTLWTYAAKSLLDPTAPLHIPARLDVRLWTFLARFGLHATSKAWKRTMDALTPIDRMALEAFDELTGNGVESWTRKGPFIVGFESESESKPFIHEIEQVEKAGQSVPLARLDNPRLKVPQLSAGVSTVLEMEGQRFLEPGPFVEALADAVRSRGGSIISGAEVRGLRHGPGGIAVDSYGHDPLSADVVVLATGAWLPKLARPLGVRTQIQAGRGYSFSVATEEPAEFPIYFPARRVACTPYQGRLRIAGTMEFRGPDEPLQTGRIDAILAAVRPLFTGMDLEQLEDLWVGPRPVTPDGLPVIGATRSPGVFVAGGHGMWGIVLGPATGKLLASQIATGTVPAELKPFDPLR
ncbi:D-amino acid dehydrogenase (deaminating) [Arthrobacter crystallopoietes BAB-32]|uniref:D-amino acid dehydrogenase (Deaminating) n=1 Tax=Arthrobacter crystallopoietes BAB-32 TaxID=1246476 RepID=N1V7P6_9MICC|nr:FAD-dependent oxidoreductase [Arthrobacter crystallopoietes]EMY34258.1 D-amino acid dehydrogenase (deaminating) [Arthrobacter crystallopoietes BAB-32]